jgi:hypothetical protein
MLDQPKPVPLFYIATYGDQVNIGARILGTCCTPLVLQASRASSQQPSQSRSKMAGNAHRKRNKMMAERKPLGAKAITIAPHAHSAKLCSATWNGRGRRRNGREAMQKWARCVTWNGRVAQPAHWTSSNVKACHMPTHVAP